MSNPPTSRLRLPQTVQCEGGTYRMDITQDANAITIAIEVIVTETK